MHFPPLSFCKHAPPPYFFHGAFAPSFIWSRRPCLYDRSMPLTYLPLPTRWRLCGLSVCVSFCEQDYWKSNEPISLKLGVMIGPTIRKSWLTFGEAPVQDTDSESLMRFTGISHTVNSQIFMKFGEMTDAEKSMNPQHFSRGPVSIQMRINLAIWMESCIAFGWNFGVAEVCALWAQSCSYMLAECKEKEEGWWCFVRCCQQEE